MLSTEVMQAVAKHSNLNNLTICFEIMAFLYLSTQKESIPVKALTNFSGMPLGLANAQPPACSELA